MQMVSYGKKNKKNIISMSLDEFAQSVQSFIQDYKRLCIFKLYRYTIKLQWLEYPSNDRNVL